MAIVVIRRAAPFLAFSGRLLRVRWKGEVQGLCPLFGYLSIEGRRALRQPRGGAPLQTFRNRYDQSTPSGILIEDNEYRWSAEFGDY